MTADVMSFLAQFRGGGARPNRYRVEIAFPSFVSNALRTAEKISFTCIAAAIPESTIGIVEIPFMGRPVKVPGDKTFNDWQVNILIDNDFLGRKAFEEWHNGILGFHSNVTTPDRVNPINVFASAQIFTLDRADQVTNHYKIDAMFPTAVGEIQLSYSENDTVMQQSVSFAINGWSSDFTD